ncbi:sugar ABC transporter substrate-binding protein [Streptomyces abyssalis]|uniref:Sugar ABC transporter substrate-binding protein n=1 Tax=Streptomyces abyssalis TaxID=933944 RepID=A0A1E7JRW5_9ACTN|nr:sugar ABC transporter substrate-binding protein [Streptomyces abyssalis]OEU91643.1 sugar ABC transporter substrate-binding protein [Streptomyces abyssalis]OEU94220.1 sugar ABC transporter substrate-binding protein [Streptomyces abyssalis]OEV28194.1 sugar ABC transporter substrate-binding protein [Streptomyces nanshensis]
MRRSRARNAAAVALAAALTAVTAGCGGGTTTDSEGSNDKPKELTYWASNQGTSVAHDKKVLAPELKRFEKKTGIKVKLEVIPWSSLLDRILAATSSGQGPDVLNIGNTWSASLQATGALLPWDDEHMAKVGGAERFTPSALAAAGAPDKDPAALPIYSLAYGLYYNKKMFKDAGIDGPPETWDELVKDGKKLTGDGKHGIALEGGDPVENSHHAFILGKQHGADFFDASGKPTFDSPGAVDAVKQYVDLLAADKIAAPGNAEFAKRESVRDFAKGKAGMLLWQAAGTALQSNGMKSDEYGVAPIPVQNPGSGEKGTRSMVAGINLAVFKNTDNIDGAMKFAKFMTSDEEQRTLNAAYGSIPPVKAAQSDKAFDTPDLKVLREVLTTSSAPLPQVKDESKFETLVGNATKDLFADAAAGRKVTTESVAKELSAAQQQMRK